MNMRKTLPLLVIASMILALIPSVLVNAAVAVSIDVSTGNVGAKIVVSGTINTFNGHYSIGFDSNGDGTIAPTEIIVASEVASGYSFTSTITVPEAYFGARLIQVMDLDASGLPTANAFFTVQTSYKVTANHATNYEGGGVGSPTDALTLTTEIHGAPQAWSTLVLIRTRVTLPGGGAAVSPTSGALTQSTFGAFTNIETIPAMTTALTTHGAYAVAVDTSIDAGVTWTERATTSFSVSLTDATAYDRTVSVYLQTQAGTSAITAITYTDPAGVESANLVPGGVAAGAWAGPILVLLTAKDSPLGVYTVKVYVGTTVSKSSTFTVNKATLSISQTTFSHSSTLLAGGPITLNMVVPRVQTVTMVFQVRYPTTVALDNIDLTGVTVKASYNGTVVSTMTLGALTDYAAGTQSWTATWKIPKDAQLGTKYVFSIDASGITDVYGNVGPKDMYNTSATFFTVGKAALYPATPILNFPASGNQIQRTLTARALVDIRYADNSRYATDDFGELNGTVTGGAGYIFAAAAADYSADSGFWILKWKVPYNADLVAGTVYQFQIGANDITDKYGNSGNAITAQSVGTFGTTKATISVANVTVSSETVQSDEQVSVSYKATYPSGDPVTTKAAGFPKVTFDSTGVNGAAVVKTASYSEATGLWTASWIVPGGALSGTYNATIAINDVQDAAATANTGPNVKQFVNFDVARVSLVDVLAASDAAKAASVLAQTKADAAKVAADTAATKADNAATAATAAQTAATAAGTAATAAGTAANGAKTAADAATAAATAAGTKADAAATAANAAKTAADSAASAANGLTTLVYAAIGASLVAAIAAIVALMQISRKIA